MTIGKHRIILSFLLFFLVSAIQIFAQKQRNYIYVFDCTESMKDFKMWEPAKQWLEEDISRQSDDASITIIPFRDNPDKVIKFTKSDFDWSKTEESLDSLISSPHSKTGVCRAWDKGIKEINTKKDNYLYLLTDGEDGYDGKNALQNRLLSWCKNNKNDYGFYVTLSEQAKMVLKDLNIDCDRFFTIDGAHLPPFGAFTPNEFTVSLRNIKAKTISFSTDGEFDVLTKCDDSNFNIEIEDGAIKNGKATFKIKPLKDTKALIEELPERYDLTCSVAPKDSEDLKIVNGDITIHIDNRPIRNLDIISEEQEGEASWYDSFLFCGKKDQDTINIPLNTQWNELAKKYNSSLKMHIGCETLKANDYKMFINGSPIKNNVFEITSNNDNNVLSLVFSDDAPDDTHYFTIKASPSDCNKLECVNDVDINNQPYENSLRITYDIDWNPLKTFLVWFCIILIALAALWFCILKPTMISKFKNSSIMVMDPYYSRIKVNGARKLVFTSRQKKDKLLPKIFLGETVYEINPIWKNELIMEPGLKKNIKVIANRNYTIDPYASNLQPTLEYNIIDNDSNEKIKVMIQ